MKDFIKWMDELPLILKFVFALPALDIVWGVYRIIRAYNEKSQIDLIVWIVLVVVGIPFMWLVDMIFILLNGRFFLKTPQNPRRFQRAFNCWFIYYSCFDFLNLTINKQAPIKAAIDITERIVKEELLFKTLVNLEALTVPIKSLYL